MKDSIRSLLAVFLFGLLLGCDSGAGVSQPSNAPGAGARDVSLAKVKKSGVLLWGADVVGGIPYVYEDPNNHGSYIGFEMDIANAIAQQLGVELKLVIKPWDTLIPELQRGSFDMAMNGIENAPERAKIVQFSMPYFVYSQQLTVRKETRGINSLADLKGKTVATLSGTAAEDILMNTPGIHLLVNPEIIYSYQALESGKADAVLLDTPIAAAYGATNPKLKNVGDSFMEGNYVIAFRKGDESLRDAVDQILESMKSSGALKSIYAKWGIMDSHQGKIGIL